MTSTKVTGHAWLDGWVQPRHTAADAVQRYREAFTGSALHLLVLPDFLPVSVAERVAEFMETEAVFTRQYAITRSGDAAHDHHEELVPEAEWLAAPLHRRFLRFGVGPGQPTRMSVGWMRYLALRAALHDARFASWIADLTGIVPGPVSSLSAHAMSAGDMLAPHSDVNRSRQLAFIIYLSRGWQASNGGSLLITGRDEAITAIEPAFNTFVLFEVTSHKSHRVVPIAETAGAARRISLGGWFDRAPTEA